jgi:hypothetical protein
MGSFVVSTIGNLTPCPGVVILITMDLTIRRFESLAEADSAEVEYYASLTPGDRLNILFDLVESGQDEDSERFERVYRVDELSRS